MKKVPLLLALPLLIAGCYVSKDPLRKEVKLLQKGVIKDDTSYVYALPFEEGTVHRLVQGYFGQFSHKERVALDFNMKRGTKVCAARDGVVVRVKEDGDRGGWNAKYRPYGNNIVIQHADGTRAGYWHLQKDGALVNVGDTVRRGQVIGLSGKTGYAFQPHLHFIVWISANGNWEQIPTRFQTTKGIKYLRPLKRYRNGKSKDKSIVDSLPAGRQVGSCESGVEIKAIVPTQASRSSNSSFLLLDTGIFILFSMTR